MARIQPKPNVDCSPLQVRGKSGRTLLPSDFDRAHNVPRATQCTTPVETAWCWPGLATASDRLLLQASLCYHNKSCRHTLQPTYRQHQNTQSLFVSQGSMQAAAPVCFTGLALAECTLWRCTQHMQWQPDMPAQKSQSRMQNAAGLWRCSHMEEKAYMNAAPYTITILQETVIHND